MLASASASRQALLRAAGVDFHDLPGRLDEAALMHDLIAKGADAGTVAAAAGGAEGPHGVPPHAPARSCWAGIRSWRLGHEIIGKCHDLAALRALLLQLSGKSHHLVSAAALARDGARLLAPCRPGPA